MMDIEKLKGVIGKKVVDIIETYDYTFFVFEDGTIVKVDYFEVGDDCDVY